MKKLYYILLFALLACGTDPQPFAPIQNEPHVNASEQDAIMRTTCYYDAWSLTHNAPAGIIPFGTQITYWVTPSITTMAHRQLQYSIKITNLGSRSVIIKGNMAPLNYLLGASNSVTTVKTFQDCSNGAVQHTLSLLGASGTPGALTNIVVSLSAVNSPHTLGSPVSNSMVWQ